MLVTELSSRRMKGLLSSIREQQIAPLLLPCKRPSLHTRMFPSRGGFGLAMVALSLFQFVAAIW